MIAHKLVDMATQIAAARSFLMFIAFGMRAKTASVAQICMLKNAVRKLFVFFFFLFVCLFLFCLFVCWGFFVVQMLL